MVLNCKNSQLNQFYHLEISCKKGTLVGFFKNFVPVILSFGTTSYFPKFQKYLWRNYVLYSLEIHSYILCSFKLKCASNIELQFQRFLQKLNKE